MTFYGAINKGLKERTNIICGNYAVKVSPIIEVIKVSMFGNTVFRYAYQTKTFSYDFCGHEGYPKTTRCINYCLEAVDAPFRVCTKKVGSAHIVQHKPIKRRQPKLNDFSK